MSYNATSFPDTPNSPVRKRVIVSPSDTVIAGTKGIYIVSDGVLVSRLSGETDPVSMTVSAGASYSMEVIQVLAGTTATVLALY